MRILKAGLAGFGPGGQIYNAPILSSTPGYSLSAVMTSNPKNVRIAQEKHPQASLVNNFQDLLDNQELDLIVITAPNHTHYTLAKQALQAGKHVVVEKPFTTHSYEAAELIELAQEKQRVLSVNHNRRWDSDFLTVQKVLQTDSLGKIVEYQAHFDRFRNYIKPGWKEEKEIPGSGILYDLGSHLIDQALVLFGMPEEVFAHLSSQRADSEVTDNFELLLFYPGLKVRLSAGMLVKKPGPRYTILGRKGSFLKYGMDPQEAALKAGDSPGDSLKWGMETEDIWGELHMDDSELETRSRKVMSQPGDYRKFYENVYQAIVHREPLEVNPEQAKQVIQIIEAAQRSHQSKRIVQILT